MKVYELEVEVEKTTNELLSARTLLDQYMQDDLDLPDINLPDPELPNDLDGMDSSCAAESETYHYCNETWVWDGESYETTTKYENGSYWFSRQALVERIKSRAVGGQTEAWEFSATDERLKGPRKTDEELLEMGYTWRWDEAMNDIVPIPEALSSTENPNSDLPNSELSAPVFPYVSWARANRSKAWYKDVDWSNIPFENLSGMEIENIDWSKVNYKEAGKSKSFDIDLIDWGEVNSGGKAQIKAYKDLDWKDINYEKLSEETREGIDWSRMDYKEAMQASSFDISIIDWGEVNSAKNIKKIYKDLNWESVDYRSLNDEVKEEIDWVRVDYIEAIRSESFSLDSIDIAELKNNQRVFKKFIKNTGLRKSGADSLLDEASSETLQTIGLNSYAGRIPGKMIKSFSTNSGQYKLVMRPSSHLRASAIAKGMGGKLAEFETASESNDFVDELTGLLADRALSRKLSKTTAPDGSSGSYLWLGGSDKSTEGDWKWLSSGDSIEESRQEWGTKVDDDSKEPDNVSAANDMNITQNSLAHGLWDLSILKPGGQWVDLIETNNLWFVVEMN